ncbi:MAG: hypothetical protein NTU51_06280 [Bacteroidetes bacterium]|nr:hypothetical protein [Bacteroidota bacterium]
MKTVKRLNVLLAVLLFASYQGFSQNTTGKQNDAQATAKVTPGKFVDANKNGVCDNYQARVNSGRGANFVDKNGDGICDNRGSGGIGRGKGNGCGMGYQRGPGNCCGGGFGYQHGQGQGRGNCCGRGNGYQHRHGQVN